MNDWMNEMQYSNDIIILIRKLEDFINGADISIECANEIERMLEENFSFDEDIREFITKLAMYRPFGGKFLFDYQHMLADATFILRKIKRWLDTFEKNIMKL